MTALINTVMTFFERYGWKYDNLDRNTILSGFAGEHSQFTLFVTVTEDWLILSISPFVECPKPDCLEKTFSYLARLNFHIILVKFSVDEKDNIVLTAELPASGVTFDSFVISLEALCFYADDQYGTLSSLATDPSAKPPSLSLL